MRLVRVRGAAMQAAADRNPGGMVAVFGLGADALEGICEEASELGSVEIANHNSLTQVAITGEEEALKRAGELAKAAGAKLVIPLKVSGPWHSRFMADAQSQMRAALSETKMATPSVPVVANVTGLPHDTARTSELLMDQLVSPVRWVRSMTHLVENGYEDFVEVGPGKVLTGLFRDIHREARVMHVQDMETLAKLMEAMGDAQG
jgi:[acyl-carrier-protein] S-malonyltransferase